MVKLIMRLGADLSMIVDLKMTSGGRDELKGGEGLERRKERETETETLASHNLGTLQEVFRYGSRGSFQGCSPRPHGSGLSAKPALSTFAILLRK